MISDYFDSPENIYGELFLAVQESHLFADSKTFVDAVPLKSSSEIVSRYHAEKNKPAFNLGSFVCENFSIDESIVELESERSNLPVQQEIERLWKLLLREADEKDGSSLIPLPNAYVVPGGRFVEIYYWDSYFTMLGLVESNNLSVVRDMVDNFAYLIDMLGFVPNGNRKYYCSRSQPPFFSLMVSLLADVSKDKRVYITYLPQMLREYHFWMGNEVCNHRVVNINGLKVGRYWDEEAVPRPESYREDVDIARGSDRDDATIFRNIRAAAETGWDFSSRWLKHTNRFDSIDTCNIVPVDLNCLLWHLEHTIAYASEIAGNRDQHEYFSKARDTRKLNIQNFFFDTDNKVFCDLLLPRGVSSKRVSLACVYPLFFKLATKAQALAVKTVLVERFLRPGGWVTTDAYSGQQWDAPNGWAPLQWMCYVGLKNYGFDELAQEAARRWVRLNCNVYEKTGLFYEKYNVENLEKLAEGGEYFVQHGFGWTNAVLLLLMKELGRV